MKKFDRALLPEAPDLSFETFLWEKGISGVGGVDEAGRGALAGPVAAAAAVLPADPLVSRELKGLNDSKLLTAGEREYWRIRLKKILLDSGLGFASHLEIDELGIVAATRLAMQRAIKGLKVLPGHLLVDFLDLPEIALPQTALVKGDARSLSIAAAAVLAKTARDARMCELARRYPGYGFEAHKGYGTLAHRQALDLLGACPIHRKSFRYSSTLQDEGSASE